MVAVVGKTIVNGILSQPQGFLHCSDSSHVKVLFIVRAKVTRQCPQTTIFEEKGAKAENRTRLNAGPKRLT